MLMEGKCRRSIALLCFALVLNLLTPVAVYAQTIRAIIAADTNDSQIGEHCQLDADNIERVLLENIPADRMVIEKLEGDDVTSLGLFTKVKEVGLKVGRSDTIFFYFSGHGFFEKDKKEHGFDLSTNEKLYRKDLRQLLLANQPRLAVLITDTCSNFVQKSKTEKPTPGTEPELSPAKLSPLFESLFLEHTGVTDISSTKPGQPAWGTKAIGGFYTYPLCQYLRSAEMNNRKLDWKTVHSDMISRTDTFFKKQAPEGVSLNFKIYETQTPYSFSLAVRPEDRLSQFGVTAKDGPRGPVIVKSSRRFSRNQGEAWNEGHGAGSWGYHYRNQREKAA